MQRIADALGVAVMTVSRDLGEFNTMLKSKRGRPRKEEPKSLVKEAAGKRRVTPEQEAKIADLVEQGVTTAAIRRASRRRPCRRAACKGPPHRPAGGTGAHSRRSFLPRNDQ